MTLIETVIGLAIIGAAFYLLISVFIALTPRTSTVESINKKVYLAQEKIEEYLARDFANVVSVEAAGFTGDFTDYSYQIVVNYVATNELNIPVAGPTNFKNVKVKVWGGPVDSAATVEIVSLVASYEISY